MVEYDLGMVKGPKGDKGDKGDTGPKGDKGDNATATPLTNSITDGDITHAVTSNAVYDAITNIQSQIGDAISYINK